MKGQYFKENTCILVGEEGRKWVSLLSPKLKIFFVFFITEDVHYHWHGDIL